VVISSVSFVVFGFCVGDDVFGDVGFLDFGVGQVHVAGVVFVQSRLEPQNDLFLTQNDLFHEVST
jgi:hypothetical protein